jgi:hypothetical protein
MCATSGEGVLQLMRQLVAGTLKTPTPSPPLPHPPTLTGDSPTPRALLERSHCATVDQFHALVLCLPANCYIVLDSASMTVVYPFRAFMHKPLKPIVFLFDVCGQCSQSPSHHFAILAFFYLH